MTVAAGHWQRATEHPSPWHLALLCTLAAAAEMRAGACLHKSGSCSNISLTDIPLAQAPLS